MSHMEREILRQFDLWPALGTIPQGEGPWLLVGCGSSYNLADLAARRLRLRGAKALAMAASEVVAFPEFIAPDSQLMALSRSGETSEVLWAIEAFRRHAAGTVWGISCKEGSRLLAEVDRPICLTQASEQAVVMTGSFNAMLRAIDQLAGFATTVGEAGQALLRQAHPDIRALAANREFSQFVFLGTGPLFPLAREGALKLTETALEATESYVTLEVRHGPKARFGPHTLVILLGSHRQAEHERRLVADLQALGAGVWHLQAEAPEIDLCYLYAPLLQLFALYRAEAKGLDPDAPRQLTPHVALD